MRIKHIYISEYKNLKEFALDFDGASFIDIFVGKNGTGKSNLFEALIEIFRQLYENDYRLEFSYTLIYELSEREQYVKWDWEKELWLDKDGSEARKPAKSRLPDNIIIYYSGHNEKITSLVHESLVEFRKGLKEANEGDTRDFIGIGKDYKSLLLSVLLLQPDDCKARQFILEKLNVTEVSDELSIVLKRPIYARKRGYDVDRFDQASRFWKAKGITLQFLDFLSTVASSTTAMVRDTGYIPPTQDNGLDDRYQLFYEINDFRAKFSSMTSQDLFRNFDNLKTIDMLDNISLELTLADGKTLGVNDFSDGQFQSVYIFSVIEMFKGKDCLTLLDEPDAFLHPGWQFKFLEQISEIAAIGEVKNHLLMTTHNPSTLVQYEKPVINIFEIDGIGKVRCQPMSKSEIIHSLSSGLITLTENEAKLNINHFLNNTEGAVLFTEGISDEIIIEVAYEKLYPGEKPNFEIQNAFSCGFLRNLIKDEALYVSSPGRKIFSLFDFDEAFGDWNQLGTDIATDPHKSLTKKYKGHESYAMLLPVPSGSISGQVINPNTGGNYGKSSLLTIELIFFEVPGLESYFTVDINRTDGFLKFCGDKVGFARDIVPGIDQSYFEVFRPMFEFIKGKIQG